MNLFDYPKWFGTLVFGGDGVYRDNGVVLTCGSSGDCYTVYGGLESSAFVRGLPGKSITVSWEWSGVDGEVFAFPITADNTYGNLAMESASKKKLSVVLKPNEVGVSVRFGVRGAGNTAMYSNIMVSLHDSPFTPYTGETFTAQLPPDTYGGEVDWVRNSLQAYEKTKLFNITSKNVTIFGTASLDPYMRFDCSVAGTAEFDIIASDRFVVEQDWGKKSNHLFKDGLISSIVIIAIKKSLLLSPDKAGFIAWLKDNPIQCLLVKGRKTLEISPTATPTALPGVNTLYSDTGDTTVSGYVDALYTSSQKDAQIADLTKRLEALESKQIDT